MTCAPACAGQRASALHPAAARQALYGALRRFFTQLVYFDVDTPLLVPAPGMEPHITAFEAPFLPETDVGQRRTLYLRFTSGDVYRYFEFPEANYQEFLRAESRGRYFLRHIRDHFRYERLAKLHVA